MSETVNQQEKRDAGRNPLGVQSISSLLVRYAVPSVVSMLVMSIYNLVDQLFIGRGVGYLGNTATTVAFPLVTVGLALALLIGNGGAAFISLELGRGESAGAKRVLGNAVTLVLGAGIAYAVILTLFLDPILRLMGTTDVMMPYAKDYMSVIGLGMPFAMIGPAMGNIVRADGSPQYSMIANLAGALLNVALDPIFIFVFKMGVKGAAIATVISQIVSAALFLLYFLKFAKYVKLDPAKMVLKAKTVRNMLALGSSSFITQMAITVLNVVLNNSMSYYGALSAYGSEIPLAAIGIVLKINGILISTILGVVIGAQPILGFNYGAKNYDRVKRTYKTEVTITLTIAVVCWLLFILTPETFIRAFGEKEPAFNEFAAMAMRVFLAGVCCAGIQIPSANYFQAVGKPLKAMVLSMSRQLLFLVPLILILPRFFGVEGILYAGPIGDALALMITLFFIVRELRDLGREEDEFAGKAVPVEGRQG